MSDEIEIKDGPTVTREVIAEAIRGASVGDSEQGSKRRDCRVRMAAIHLKALAVFLAGGEEHWPDIHPFASSKTPVPVFKMLVRALLQAGRDGRDLGSALDAIVQREQGLQNVNRGAAAAIALDRDRLIAIHAAVLKRERRRRGKTRSEALLVSAE